MGSVGKIKVETRLTIFFNSAENVVDVVGEEALRIQHRLNKTSDGAEGHVLRVRVPVPL